MPSFAGLFRRRRQGVSHLQHDIKGLEPTGSSLARVAASSAAILLVIASAGFGCVFAYTQGAHQGTALALLALAMALGLEVAKPFAVEGVFSSLRSWAVGRALAMALLAIVAIGYSLTAELSLMAMARADGAASRSQVTTSAKDDRADLVRLVAERASMRFTPATAEAVSISREMVAAAERTRAAECGQRGKHCRAREADESTARQKLAEVLANKVATDRAAELNRSAAAIRERLARTPATAAADPGAAALASYLGIFGVTVDSSTLAQWLVLVGVIALEIGSALAVLLVGAVGGRRRPVQELVAYGPPEPVRAAPEAPAQPQTAAGRVSKKSRRGRPAKERLKAEAKVIDLLKARGGKLSKNSTTRKLGRMVGARKSTMHLAVAALLASGVIAKTATGLVLNA